MKIVVVIPTYNEADNIKQIVPMVLQSLNSIARHEGHILIVDGNSPDGTGNIVKEMATRDTRIHLLMEKEKSGLGGAYIYAFNYAMNEMQADVIVEMDADLQHDPKELPNFIKKIDEGYDYVIGSRFTKGGSIPKDWGMSRKFLSVGGNIFSRAMLGIKGVSDFTSGYKASRVQGYLNRIDLSTVRSRGFAYKIDLLHKMYKLGAKIAEVPIEFGLRDKGVSKMEGSNALESARVVISIRMSENKEFVRFLFAGIAGLTTDSVLFNVLRITLLESESAALVSGFIAMIVTFTINNLWSFNERKIGGWYKILGTFVFYIASSIIPILLRSQLVLLFVNIFGNTFIAANAGFLLGVVIGLIWNYFVYSRIIWRKNPDKD